jgi:hypothetical protein
MMSSGSAGASQVSGTRTYLDDGISGPDIDFDLIKSRITCAKFHDSVWGFPVKIYPLTLPFLDGVMVRCIDA